MGPWELQGHNATPAEILRHVMSHLLHFGRLVLSAHSGLWEYYPIDRLGWSKMWSYLDGSIRTKGEVDRRPKVWTFKRVPKLWTGKSPSVENLRDRPNWGDNCTHENGEETVRLNDQIEEEEVSVAPSSGYEEKPWSWWIIRSVNWFPPQSIVIFIVRCM